MRKRKITAHDVHEAELEAAQPESLNAQVARVFAEHGELLHLGAMSFANQFFGRLSKEQQKFVIYLQSLGQIEIRGAGWLELPRSKS